MGVCPCSVTAIEMVSERKPIYRKFCDDGVQHSMVNPMAVIFPTYQGKMNHGSVVSHLKSCQELIGNGIGCF